VIAERNFDAGCHDAVWNGLDSRGARVSSGVYFARLAAPDGRVDSVKMVVLR
jgi:hypothetical protein